MSRLLVGLGHIIGGAEVANGYDDANSGGTVDVDSPIGGAAVQQRP
jgi:hypothetical protein